VGQLLDGLPVYYRVKKGWRRSDVCPGCRFRLYECCCPLDRRPWLYRQRHYPKELMHHTHIAQHTDYPKLNRFGVGLSLWWTGLCLLSCGFFPGALLIPYLIASLLVTMHFVAAAFADEDRS